MDKLKILNRVEQLYKDNKNIIKFLKNIDGRESNSIEDIMVSYDFQAGTYITQYLSNPIPKRKYCTYLADALQNLGKFNTLLEVGIGEGTTLGPLIQSLDYLPQKCYGFDISWSRVKYAKSFLESLILNNVDIQLFTGDLFCIPLKDNSIDIVYTSHSIEPNGGREEEALIELYRITNKYLILLEPSYEFANEEARTRMLNHGYITKLYETAKRLNYKIVEHRLFDISMNSLNPTGIMIIEKKGNSKILTPLCCPVTKSEIIRSNNAFFSKESLLAYPIIAEIPCLLRQNAIIASKFIELTE